MKRMTIALLTGLLLCGCGDSTSDAESNTTAATTAVTDASAESGSDAKETTAKKNNGYFI